MAVLTSASPPGGPHGHAQDDVGASGLLGHRQQQPLPVPPGAVGHEAGGGQQHPAVGQGQQLGRLEPPLVALSAQLVVAGDLFVGEDAAEAGP